MVIDTSALLAIFLAEPERKALLDLITRAETRYISTANVFETGIVLEARRREAPGREFEFLHDVKLEVVPADLEQVEVARVAWRKYGKDRHRSGLNFEDCFAYALAKVTGEPVLFKAHDFVHTDIPPAIT